MKKEESVVIIVPKEVIPLPVDSAITAGDETSRTAFIANSLLDLAARAVTCFSGKRCTCQIEIESDYNIVIDSIITFL